MSQKLTKEQANIITGFTGVSAGNFGDFQIAAEKKLGRVLFTHEFALHSVWEEIKEAFKDDFIAMCAS